MVTAMAIVALIAMAAATARMARTVEVVAQANRQQPGLRRRRAAGELGGGSMRLIGGRAPYERRKRHTKNSRSSISTRAKKP
jgi:hypothetical protein